MSIVLDGTSGITTNSGTVVSTTDATLNGLTVGKGGGSVSTNTAVGASAIGSSNTGNYNTAVGQSSLTGNTTGANNTAIGWSSGTSNTTGSNNAYLAQNAGYWQTTGSYNVAVGSAAFQGANGNATGSSNTAVGMSALQNNTTASNNTAVGYQAGYTNTTGIQKTCVGSLAGYSGTASTSSTCIGYYSGYNTTGTDNTLIGTGAGYLITTGAKNTVLGEYSGNQGGLDIRTSSNYIVLSDGDGNPRAYWDNSSSFTFKGATGSVTGTNLNQGADPYGVFTYFDSASPNNTTNYFMRCRDSTSNRFYVYSNGTCQNSTGTYTTISDAKLKENIVDTSSKLDKLNQVRVVNYNLIGDELKQIGFVAQELEQVFPSLVFETTDLDENNNDLGTTTKGVKLTVMIPILIKALQELKTIVDAQAAEIAELKAKVG
jgi:Chaperone of endosialidase